MRALLCRSLDEGIDGLRVEDVPPPSLPPDGVRIEVHAAAMNFADTLLVRGRYQEQPPLPFAPGLEAAGVVLEVAPGVQHVLPGERVVALLDHGGFAEEATAITRAPRPWPTSTAVRPTPPEAPNTTSTSRGWRRARSTSAR